MATVITDSNIRIEKLTLGPYETNAYIVVCRRTRESLVADAPAGIPEIIKELDGTKPRFILLTHDHHDHTGVLASLRSRLKGQLADGGSRRKRLQAQDPSGNPAAGRVRYYSGQPQDSCATHAGAYVRQPLLSRREISPGGRYHLPGWSRPHGDPDGLHLNSGIDYGEGIETAR
jgi:glyoxylase-like metal-dependent hydrolase (beta-lactamase superfamily II)